MLSIFDGVTEYSLGQETAVGTGCFVCPDALSVVRHAPSLPSRCALRDAPRVLLRVLGWNDDGSSPVPGVGQRKLAVTHVLPVAVLPYRASTSPPGGVQLHALGRPHSAGRRPTETAIPPAEAWRRWGGGQPQSERMQARTALLEEDLLEAAARLERVNGLRLEAVTSDSAWMRRALAREGVTD